MPDENTIGTVLGRSLQEEMQTSYMEYAMSVIISRALPEVRDGLKPVQRRILYAMHRAGATNASRTKKSAAFVGDVLKLYHPHGDTAVYDALVRMAQPFSLRYPLIEGQGNFGSVDGDPAAAMRYTEAKLSAITGELMADIADASAQQSSGIQEINQTMSLMEQTTQQNADRLVAQLGGGCVVADLSLLHDVHAARDGRASARASTPRRR